MDLTASHLSTTLSISSNESHYESEISQMIEIHENEIIQEMQTHVNQPNTSLQQHRWYKYILIVLKYSTWLILIPYLGSRLIYIVNLLFWFFIQTGFIFPFWNYPIG
eukprot:NODE_167_length_14562_cov_0.357256.p15 type:complete len:107 gc:universal NODE_167_length_14562_cov_0.357256:3666-3346(-)